MRRKNIWRASRRLTVSGPVPKDSDSQAFQRFHISARWAAETFHRLACNMDTTFRGKIYTRWCCIDRLSRQGLSECGNGTKASYREEDFSGLGHSRQLPGGATSKSGSISNTYFVYASQTPRICMSVIRSIS